jgi:hypothetical protein
MPASEAQIAASRANGLKSRGPVTADGKAISRRNSFRHGMAGNGVVLTPVDSAEVERRSSAMQVEMAPRTEMGTYLVDRLAELTVRVQRCSRNERAATEARVAIAGPAFDEARIAEVDHTLAYIAKEPATYSRKLRSMPEGIDRMIALLLDLREELNTGRWDWHHGDKVANLTGARYMDLPVSRVRALSEAIVGDFRYLLPSEGEGLSVAERVDWARNAMADRIDEELQMLLDHRKTLDLESIEADRAGAADRALFDPSKEATLARRYEAAAERGVYRALAELARAEAEVVALAPEETEETEEEPSSGSFRAEVPGPPTRPAASRTNHAPVVVRGSEGPQRVGRAGKRTA